MALEPDPVGERPAGDKTTPPTFKIIKYSPPSRFDYSLIHCISHPIVYLIPAASSRSIKIPPPSSALDTRLAPLAAAEILQQTPAPAPLSSSPLVRQSPIAVRQVMPESQGNPSQTPSQGSSRGRPNHGRRGGRTGRGGKPKNGHSEGSSDAPALNGDVASAAATPENSTRASNQRSRGNRNRPSKRHTGISGSAPNGPRPTGRRAFGGQLTSATEAGEEPPNTASSAPAGLSVDAPEFVPGQPVVSRR